MITRHRIIAGLVIVATVIIIMWLRREPDWEVTLVADQGSQITPWQTVNLIASVAPADAMDDHHLKWGDWKVTWDVDSTPLPIRGTSGAFRSGKIGDRTITVTVESPWGTKKRASIHKTVAYRSYVRPDSPTLQVPDLAMLPKDPSPEDLPFGIADVWVEKTEVCQGEPTRIRLTPFDKRGQDKWLVPVVAGEQAWDVAFIAMPTHPGPHLVPVSLFDSGSKGGKVDSIDTYVYIEVKDCIAPFPMFVEHRPIPPDDDAIAFRLQLYNGPAWLAKLRDASAPSPIGKASSFRWTFGDGTVATTAEPEIQHRYPDELARPDERATLYKVSVDAIDGGGKVMATSFASIEVPNHLRQLKQEQGLVQLVTRQAPGSQENPDGSRYADIVLTNIDPVETARISDLKIALTSCDGKSLGETPAAPSTVFSKLAIGPRSSISGRFSLPVAEGVCFANAEVSGTSEPGKLKVLGFFQLVTTAEPPGVALTEQQEQVLQQAMELLGNPKVVTNEDLQRLENEGKIPRYVLTKDPFGQ